MSPIPRVFLSYSSKDMEEVEDFDLELRRRGVPLWRDRSDLRIGRLSAVEIEKAGQEAAGFVVYLTLHAARSDWVRERELDIALHKARRSPAFGLVPVFRADRREVTEEMIRLGKKPHAADGSSPYDLQGFNGCVIKADRASRGFLPQELAAAADHILDCLLDGIGERRTSGPLRIGVVTRDASLASSDLDLLIDCREDFPLKGPLPDPAQCEARLLPAFRSLHRSLFKHGLHLEVRLTLQCHLTLALALGHQFRRNTGSNLEVLEIHGGELWPGPKIPLSPAHDLWSSSTADGPGDGPDLALIIGVSGSIGKRVESFLKDQIPSVSRRLIFEPARGSGKTSLQGLEREGPHRMAVAVMEQLSEAREEQGYRTVHLFYAGPPALAALIAQQLSNCGPVQTYEWIDHESTYRPTFRLE